MKLQGCFVSLITSALCVTANLVALSAEPIATQAVESLSVNAQADPDSASFILKGRLRGLTGETNEARLIYSLQSQATLSLNGLTNTERIEVEARIHQGQLRELVLAMLGQGEVRQVTGEGVRDWSVRHGTNGARFLVIRPVDPDHCTNRLNAVVESWVVAVDLPAVLAPLLLHSQQAA